MSASAVGPSIALRRAGGSIVRRAAAPPCSERTPSPTAGGLPAAAHAVLALERLLRGLAAVLAAVERHLAHRHEEDEQREERDEDEPGVRHDLVVRLAPGALAA